MEQRWRAELEAWLKPFLEALRHKTRARMCPAYVAGLIGAGDRKSVQPMASRDDQVGYDQLHHFIADGAWDAVPLEKVLLTQADRMVGGEEAWLIVDDTALPKKGDHSVGVAPQYASVLGKNANCQTLVSLTLASREVPVMLGLRLFLPESWTSDQRRLNRARVPEEYRTYRTKPEIALQEIDRLRAAGVRFGCVLADAGYGLSAPFRQGLTERGLAWAVGIPCKQKVYPVKVAMIFPVAGRGRPRKRHIPDVASIAAQSMLETASWRMISWRRGTKGRLKARFAALRVRVADGPPQRIGSMGAQHLPGEEAWLIGERRSTGEYKYYLSNLPPNTPLKQLARAIKARWVCEQAHQQLKEELGLDHFEGRSWAGLHRHALMTMIAYAFLQSRRLKCASRKKKNRRPASSTQFTDHQSGHHHRFRPTATLELSALPWTTQCIHSAKVVLASQLIESIT
jgi:SRSO17 transposase